jgi:demethylspheroidene O-methyltransferase
MRAVPTAPASTPPPPAVDAAQPSPGAPPARLLGRLNDRWLGLRDRLIADPAFQRWASASPFTRRIARRKAMALFDLCAGFVYSQILQAAVRLDLFRHLADGPLPLADLAVRLRLDPDAAARLLDACVALKLVQRRSDGRYGLGELGAALVGNPGVAAMVEHHAVLYRDLADPVALLRGERDTELSRFWPYARDDADPGAGDAEAAARYSALMAASQPLVADDILAAYPFARHRRLLDVAGGDGRFLLAVAAAAPRLDLTVFDLPPVAERAQGRIAAAGLAGRARAVGGSFTADALPGGADVVTLVRVLHDHDDTTVRTLLAAVHAALEPGGTVVIAEPMAGAAGAEPVGDAYFGFYLMAMGRGRPRSPERLCGLLAEAGFAAPAPVSTRRPMLTGMVTARRPDTRDSVNATRT